MLSFVNPQNPALFQMPEEQVAPYGHFIQVTLPWSYIALVLGEVSDICDDESISRTSIRNK